MFLKLASAEGRTERSEAVKTYNAPPPATKEDPSYGRRPQLREKTPATREDPSYARRPQLREKTPATRENSEPEMFLKLASAEGRTERSEAVKTYNAPPPASREDPSYERRPQL
jgi:hypothetical protein